MSRTVDGEEAATSSEDQPSDEAARLGGTMVRVQLVILGDPVLSRLCNCGGDLKGRPLISALHPAACSTCDGASFEVNTSAGVSADGTVHVAQSMTLEGSQ